MEGIKTRFIWENADIALLLGLFFFIEMAFPTKTITRHNSPWN
jgi:hypothetical protein